MLLFYYPEDNLFRKTVIFLVNYLPILCSIAQLDKPEFAVICFLGPDRHRQSADNNQNQPGKRLSAQLFFEYEIGKSDGNDNAELIDWYDNADDAVLYGVIVTEP